MSKELKDQFVALVCDITVNGCKVGESDIIQEAIDKLEPEGMTQELFDDWMNDPNFPNWFNSKLHAMVKVKYSPKGLRDLISDKKNALNALKFFSDAKNSFSEKPSDKNFSVATIDYLQACQGLIIHPNDKDLQKFQDEHEKYNKEHEEYIKNRLSQIPENLGGTKK